MKPRLGGSLFLSGVLRNAFVILYCAVICLQSVNSHVSYMLFQALRFVDHESLFSIQKELLLMRQPLLL